MVNCHFIVLLLITSFFQMVLGELRILPPSGALVVRAGTNPVSGEFSTISGAVSALPNDNSSQVIFVFPGTYKEQVYINRTGPLTIFGFTIDTSSFLFNQVSIEAGVPASVAGSDDASGTLRIHKNDFKMYNVNVKNTFGPGTQAIAISQYGSRVGLYACGFFGYQDTLYANVGTQVYLKGYIEGAVDFIFGRQGLACFGGNTIGVKGPGCVSASGRQLNDTGSYVFNKNIIVAAPGATNITNTTYLGRPWGAFAKVIFKNTVITAPLNPALWSIWNPGDERTSDVLFADFNTRGVHNVSRPSFATALNASEAKEYSISSAVGSDYASWVDAAYLV